MVVQSQAANLDQAMVESPNQGMATRLVLFHAGAIGDVLLSRPVLLALRRFNRQAAWEAVGYPSRLALLQHELALHRIHSLDAAWVSRFLGGTGSPASLLASLRDSRTIIVSFVEGLPPAGSPQKVVRFTVSPPDGQRTHVQSYLHHQLSKHGIAGDLAHIPVPMLPLSKEVEQRAEAWLRDAGIEDWLSRPLVALHAGSGSVRKCWPLEGYVEIAAWLRERCHARVLSLVGAAERERFGDKLRTLEDAGSLTLETPQLDLLGAVLRRCHLYLGNDSGISHLAAAVGCFSIVLFGVTDWRIWSPRGQQVQIITASREPPAADWRRLSPLQAETIMRRISVRQVCEAIARLDRPALLEERKRRLRVDQV